MPDEVWGRDYPPLGRTSDVHKLESAQLNQQENHSQVLYYSELDLNPPYMVSISRFLFYFCVLNYLITGNFRGRKLSWISLFCGYLRKFSPQNLVAWHPLAWQKRAIRENFSAKIVFFTNLWKFSPLKVFRYTCMLNANCSTKKVTGVEQSY